MVELAGGRSLAVAVGGDVSLAVVVAVYGCGSACRFNFVDATIRTCQDI